MVLGNEGAVAGPSSVTPPVHCSSRNSVTGDSTSGRQRPPRTVTPADSMEYINKIIFDKPWPGRTGSHGQYHYVDSCSKCGICAIRVILRVNQSGTHAMDYLGFTV